MSWLFSAALVAAYSRANCSGGDASAQLSVMPTPQPFWRNDKPMDVLKRSPFGLTWKPLTADRGEELLTWYRAGFPARTSHAQARAPESKASIPGFGGRWRELSVKYDRGTCSWKTHQCLWDEVLPECSVTLTRWGMMQSGVCWERLTPVRRTRGTESGLCRTPDASVVTDGAANAEDRKRQGHAIGLHDQVNTPSMWPTPRSTEREGLQSGMNRQSPTLSTVARMWPTPRANKTTNENEEAWQKRHAAGDVSTPPLSLAVRMVPTPSANDWKVSSQPGQRRGQLADPEMNVITAGGSLNPDWVEWLMGWPLAWTSLRPMRKETWLAWQRAFRTVPTD